MAYGTNSYIAQCFGIIGQPTTTHWLSPGSDASSVNEIRWTCPIGGRIVAMVANERVAPGAAFVDTLTLNINGVASACVITITGSATTGTYTTPVNITALNEISIQWTTTGGVATRDVNAWVFVQYAV
jgi:hypothetical protein